MAPPRFPAVIEVPENNVVERSSGIHGNGDQIKALSLTLCFARVLVAIPVTVFGEAEFLLTKNNKVSK